MTDPSPRPVTDGADSFYIIMMCFLLISKNQSFRFSTSAFCAMASAAASRPMPSLAAPSNASIGTGSCSGIVFSLLSPVSCSVVSSPVFSHSHEFCSVRFCFSLFCSISFEFAQRVFLNSGTRLKFLQMRVNLGGRNAAVAQQLL